MAIAKMTDLELKDKRVLIRVDFNVPFVDGVITSDKRITAALPTIQYALVQGARVILMSHLGRPEEGAFDPAASLVPVAERLSKLLGQTVPVLADFSENANHMDVDVQPGQCVMLENVRFLTGEKKDNEELGKRLANLCDVFVMDAFASAHRAHASTHAVAKFAPQACAGLLLAGELEALHKALDKPAKPLFAIVGGSKVSTKLILLGALLQKVDQLIPGGGIANTFLKAAGFEIGKSLYEPELVADAGGLINVAKMAGRSIPLPVDVVVATEVSETAETIVRPIGKVQPEDMILDIGPKTVELYAKLLEKAGTIVWNGPVGVFEKAPFRAGTKALGEAIANSKAFSIAGGGDTVSAIEMFGLTDKISYISTAGGAFLEFLEGKTLPAVAILEERAKEMNSAKK